MGFNLMIEGQDKLSYNKDIISTVQADLSSPSDSRAKTTVANMTLVITGKLHADSDGTNSETVKLFQWAQVPAGQETVYRKVTVQVDTVPQRTIVLDKAFVVNYNEAYSTQAGVGTFTLVVRQKTDVIDAVKIEGGSTAAVLGAAADLSPASLESSLSQTGAGNNMLNDLVQTAGMAELNKLDPSGLAANALTNLENAAQQTGGITSGGVLNTVGRAAVMAAVSKGIQSGFGSAGGQAVQAPQSDGAIIERGQTPNTGTVEKVIPAEPATGAPGQTVPQSVLSEGSLQSVGRAAVMAAMNPAGSSGTAASLTNAKAAVIHNLEETVVRTQVNKVEPSGIAAQIINNSLNKQ